MFELITTGPRADRQREICGKLYAFCGTCGEALDPCAAGGDDAVLHGPRYIGFHPCCPRRGCGGEPDPLLGSRREPIYQEISNTPRAEAMTATSFEELKRASSPAGNSSEIRDLDPRLAPCPRLP